MDPGRRRQCTEYTTANANRGHIKSANVQGTTNGAKKGPKTIKWCHRKGPQNRDQCTEHTTANANRGHKSANRGQQRGINQMVPHQKLSNGATKEPQRPKSISYLFDNISLA